MAIYLQMTCLVRQRFYWSGGKTYSVAKDVNLLALKVFGADGKSRFSDIIAALEYVIYRKQKEPSVPIVINMSLGTEQKAILLNKAVDKASEVGIPVVVAAGNGGRNKCTYSPVSASSAITVAASTMEEYVRDCCNLLIFFDGAMLVLFHFSRNRLSYSNRGRCVDLYTPGERVWSAWSQALFRLALHRALLTSLVLSRCTLVEQQNKYWKFSSVASTEGYTQPSAQCWGLWAKRHMISTKMHTKYHIEAHCPVLRLNNKAKI